MKNCTFEIFILTKSYFEKKIDKNYLDEILFEKKVFDKKDFGKKGFESFFLEKRNFETVFLKIGPTSKCMYFKC